MTAKTKRKLSLDKFRQIKYMQSIYFKYSQIMAEYGHIKEIVETVHSTISGFIMNLEIPSLSSLSRIHYRTM